MTQDEITALAREYAKGEFKAKRSVDAKADEAEQVIHFLLSRYCLVEKSEVEVHLRSARQLEKDAAALKIKQLGHVGRTRSELIKALFPDMALKDEAAVPEEE